MDGLTGRDLRDHGPGIAWITEYVRLSMGDDQVVNWYEAMKSYRAKEMRT